jgi:hypothetical protein
MRNCNADIKRGINKVYARGELEVPAVNGKSVIIDVPSSDGSKTYRLDLTLGRCSCRGWTMHAKKSGGRACCKHLRAYGFSDIL